MATKFEKDQFFWDGMYLTYRGRHTESRNMEDVYPNCHSSWIGKPKPEHIACFKYGAKPYKSWIKCIMENYTVEEYLKVARETSPLEAVQRVGYVGRGRY